MTAVDAAPQHEPLMTTREVMMYLRISRTKLWRLMQSGELEAYRVGGELRFRRESIDAYLETMKVQITNPDELED